MTCHSTLHYFRPRMSGCKQGMQMLRSMPRPPSGQAQGMLSVVLQLGSNAQITLDLHHLQEFNLLKIACHMTMIAQQ